MRHTITLLALLLAWLSAASAGAQTIAEMSAGAFYVCSPDEICLMGHRDDAPKIRLGVRRQSEDWGRSLGALSWNLQHLNDSQEEMVLIQGKETEVSGRKTRGGELWIGVKAEHTESDDDAMKTALELTAARGWEFKLPISAPNLPIGGSGGTSAPPTHLTAGAYQLHLQASDGNFVLYERVSETMCPRWAINWLGSYYRDGTGYVDPAVLPEACR